MAFCSGIRHSRVTPDRREKFAAARHRHVGVSVSHHGSPVAIDDLAVERRDMIALFLDDLERPVSVRCPERPLEIGLAKTMRRPWMR